jgi:hypothetical protein
MKIKLPLTIAGAVLLTAAPAMAADLDLTAGGTGTINSAIFTTTDNQSTGTGVIQSFVRVQDPNGSADGYNADARPVMQDVNTSPTFTHDILLSSVPEVTLGGIVYYEFLLDINQNTNDPLLSLDELQIYTRATAIADADDLLSLTSSSTLRYDLDTALVNNRILLNYNLNSGSGSGDLFAYIPKSLFGAETDFLYLYSLFGEDNAGNYNENDGFEEWAVRTQTNTFVPDGGATVTLLGSALLGLSALRRRFGRG